MFKEECIIYIYACLKFLFNSVDADNASINLACNHRSNGGVGIKFCPAIHIHFLCVLNYKIRLIGVIF